jgi:hypothetical protein
MSPSSLPREARRCAIHPARPAHDECPLCERPRCLADARAFDRAGCAACAAPAAGRGARPAGAAELAVRAGLAGLAVVYLGGWMATQYVRVHLMALAAPAVVGLAAAFVVPRAARRIRPSVVAWVIAAVAALLGTALGFALTPGGQNPLRQWSLVGGPYLAALVGVALGPLVFGRPQDRDTGGDQPPGDGEVTLGAGSDR